jgi:hypothetical protein
MKIAIHSKINFKPESSDTNSFASLAEDFSNFDLSIDEIANHIGLGHSFCAQHNGRRKRKNFIASNIAAVDMDGGMTIKEALENVYVKNNAGIVYPTWNNTPTHNRFRIVFFFERTITNIEMMENLYTGLIRKFGGDGACKDACRIFYGNKKEKTLVLGNVLSNELLDELIMLGAEKRQRAEQGESESIKAGISTTRAERHLVLDQMVETISGSIETVANLKKGTVVRCPFHIDKTPSAFITESRSGTKGIHCSKCTKTFWPQSISFKEFQSYDFNKMDSDLHAIEFSKDPYSYLDGNAPLEFFNDDGRVVLPGSARRLTDIKVVPGITLVRSPKDTGKTHKLAQAFQACKAEGLSVLLIGHRQSLISSIAKRIGLDCYLDRKDSDGNPIPVSSHYAICLDSIPRLLDLRMHHFDVIIIDESEQVFSHLTSDTLRKQRRDCFLKMERLLKKARTVIACDADLGYLTLSAIASARDGELPVQFYVNRYKATNKEVDIYSSENQLLSELIRAVKSGGRYYVCCNSKKKAEIIEKAISALAEVNLRVILITGDNSQLPKIRQFIDNIIEEALDYDVIVSSPTLGTGIDITFPGNAQLIDGVFGFFSARINTHFDVDQQLSRVRNPKFVKVWISPERFTFEIEPDVIKHNCVDLGELPDVQISYDENDIKVFDYDDRLLSLYAEVLSLQRASKNNLKQHFIDLKIQNGWKVNMLEADESGTNMGRDARKAARLELNRTKTETICSAPRINNETEQALSKLAVLHAQDQARLHRYRLEEFYGERVTPALVELDNNGTYRHKLRLLATYLAKNESAKEAQLAASAISTLSKSNELDAQSLLRELFSSAGLIDAYGYFIKGQTVCNAELQTFKNLCIQRKISIESLLKISVRADISTKPVTQLGEFLREIGCSWNKALKRDVDGQRINFYTLNFEEYEIARKYAESINERRSFVNEAPTITNYRK